jgi:dTDP-4-dehydrorhamnose reductase
MGSLEPVVVIGASGMLGSAVTILCADLGVKCHAYPESHLDITDPAALEVTLARVAEQSGSRAVVINAAAFTNVELAEDQEERAFAVNDRGARNLAEAATRHGLGLIHVSTDFVFDGTKEQGYKEEDIPNPLNAYGRSKLAGERAVLAAYPEVLLVRTAWVYGPGGDNFPRKIIERARHRDVLEVVSDEIGSPTYSIDLARGLLELWRLGATGVFHLAGSGSCSRYEMAQEVIDAAGLATRLVPVASSAFPSRAMRPARSVLCLDKSRRLGVEMPPWRESLRSYVSKHLV